jgi:DNA-binding Lrp family transcriptional regulator
MNINLDHILKKASPSKQNYLKPIEVSDSSRQVTNEFKRDPERWFSMYPRGVATTFEVILEADNNLKFPTLLLQTIADRVGVSVRTVIQYIKILIRGGLISKIQRYAGTKKNPRFRSSIFLVSDYFHNLFNRKRLCHLFKAFLYTPFILLAMSNGVCHKIGTSLQLEKVNDYVNLFSLYNSFVLIGNKDNQLSVKRSRDDTMELKQYPNMHKRSESDNKRPWANIVKRAHQGSINRYPNGIRPPVDGGSVKSEFNNKRERIDREAQILREMENSTKILVEIDLMHNSLDKLNKICDRNTL